MSAAARARAATRVDLVERVRASHSVSNFLMPASWDAELGQFALADLAVGVLFELTPLSASVLSDDELGCISDAAATALSRLPEHALVQATILPAADIDLAIEDYRAQGGAEHPVIASHERLVAEQFRRSLATPLFSFQHGEGGFTTKRYRILLSVVVRPDATVGGARSGLVDFLGGLFRRRARSVARTSAEERFLALRARLGKRLAEAARRLEGTLRTNRLAVRRLGPDELIALTRMQLWPDAARLARVRHDPCQPLAPQIPLGDVAVETASGSVLAGGWVHKVLTMSGVPRATSPGTTTLPCQALGWFTLLDYIGDGAITVAAHAKPLQDLRTFIEKRTTFVRGGFAIPAKVEQLLKDCELASYYLETDRRRMFDVQLSIAVRARSEREAQELAEKVRDKAADIGIDCRVETHLGPSLAFQALPFGFAPTIPEARRTFILPDRSLADLMPLFMLARGTRHGALLLHNRLGEPFALDLFDSPTAAHAVMCGESGSGKSFLANYLIYSVLRRPDAQVFAIDKGKSYATATAMLGSAGSYHAMGLSAKTCINAFAGTLASASAFLRQFIAHLASQVPSDRLTSDQLGIVDACIAQAFQRKQQAVRWRLGAELAARCARGAWVDRQRKRFAIAPLDEVARATVEALKSREGGRTPEFEIYARAWLLGRTPPARLGGAVGGQTAPASPAGAEIIRDARSVNAETARWLAARGFLLEDHPGEDGLPRACVLYRSATQERTLELEGFATAPVPGAQVLEVAHREDLRLLAETGVRIAVPEAFRAERRAALLEQARAAHPEAEAGVLAAIAEARLAEDDPRLCFDAVDGEATIQHEVFFTDFIRELEDWRDGAAARPIAARLSAYHGSGALAGFFDGETQFRLDEKRLATFELQELSSAGEHLVAAVVGTLLQMLVLHCQSEHLANGGPRAWRKYIVLDEFWALLAVPMVADLVVTGLRTLRKHNTAIICISQLVRDFTTSESGKVVLAASQHRILLRQPPDVVSELDRHLDWSEEQQALMQTVVSAKGLFSEALIDIPNQGLCEVARFVPTPYAYWIFTTAPEDVKARELARTAYRAEGCSPDAALDRALADCARRWPHGVAASERRA